LSEKNIILKWVYVILKNKNGKHIIKKSDKKDVIEKKRKMRPLFMNKIVFMKIVLHQNVKILLDRIFMNLFNIWHFSQGLYLPDNLSLLVV
jgi:hypothetical protein